MGGNSLIDRLFKRESTTKEEIRQLVDEDQAKGELEASQREMIHNIFDFDRLCAEDIMTHRTEIEAVEETATIGYAAASSKLNFIIIGDGARYSTRIWTMCRVFSM